MCMHVGNCIQIHFVQYYLYQSDSTKTIILDLLFRHQPKPGARAEFGKINLEKSPRDRFCIRKLYAKKKLVYM